ARSVNTLTLTKERKISGDNTDGAGLVIDLRNNLGFTVTRKRVLILGAGGAARGILAPLLTLSPKEIVLANRTPDRAAAIAAEFGDLGPMRGCGFDEVTPEPFHLIVNATSASLQGSVPQVTPRVIDRKTLCYDMAYSAGDTPFVRWAAQHGCARAVQGWGMLVEQAAEAFWIWRGIRPDTEPVIQALRRHPGAMARAG
ncbi:MAG: shikimate dehydrogenase, partial [Steroidobacteraceae bacterium]